MTNALSGTKVVDLTRVLAGPLCTMMLGDLGAHVIKVERPGAGDETRGWGPPFDARGESAYYLSVNRNKLSLAADLGDAGDRALVERLIGEADVVVDNFLPGALERMSLSPDALLARSPRLVWCTIGGFGPGSKRPGYDFVVQAEAGWMAITGEKVGEPMKTGVALADILAGKDACIAIIAALAGVARGADVERRLHISLARSARAALINVAQNTLVSGQDARRWGNAHANLVPYQLFRAADRPLVIAVGSDGQWRACAEALELPGLAADPQLATNAGRIRQRERVVSALEARLAERPADEWLTRLQAVGVPSGIVKSVIEAIDDALAEGPSALMGMPSSVSGKVRQPPPRLDEHGALIRAQGWGAFRGYP